MKRKGRFSRYIAYEKRQLDVNETAQYQSYAGTCYHAEQYAEKVIKAKYDELGLNYKKNHQTDSLIRKLAESIGTDLDGKEYTKAEDAATSLALYYKKVRYPPDNPYDPLPRITKASARKCVSDAKTVVKWIDGIDSKTNLASRSPKGKKHGTVLFRKRRSGFY